LNGQEKIPSQLSGKSGGGKEKIEPVKKTSKFLGINEIRNRLTNPVLEEKQETVAEVWADQPFDEAQLVQGWNMFLEKLRKEERDTEYTTLNQEYTIEDKYVIRLALANSLQEVIVERFQMELITFLRGHVRNKNIVLRTEVSIGAASKRTPYTKREKFEFLLEKFPVLASFRSRFDLDLDS